MSRRISFSSAHFYFQPNWNDTKNNLEFGKCFSKHGHGHNYVIEAYFQGPVQGDTGLLVNLVDIEPLLKKISNELDHKHLNFDVPYFAKLIPTTENIAVYLWQRLQDELRNSTLQNISIYKLKLSEDPELWVEVT